MAMSKPVYGPPEFVICPICGRGLTVDDISFYDAEHEYMAYANDEVELIAVGCSCGFSYSAGAVCVDYPDPAWLAKFRKLANRRAK